MSIENNLLLKNAVQQESPVLCGDATISRNIIIQFAHPILIVEYKRIPHLKKFLVSPRSLTMELIPGPPRNSNHIWIWNRIPNLQQRANCDNCSRTSSTYEMKNSPIMYLRNYPNRSIYNITHRRLAQNNNSKAHHPSLADRTLSIHFKSKHLIHIFKLKQRNSTVCAQSKINTRRQL